MRIHSPDHTDNPTAMRCAFMGRIVADCGIATFPPDFVAHRGEAHRHEHDEVFIILAGEVTVPITGGPSGIAKTGHWVLVEAGEEHHLTNHTTQPCIAMFLVLKATLP